jgi:hypothetical protein
VTEFTKTASPSTATQARETAATFVARLTLAEADHSPGYLAVGQVGDAWATVQVSTRGTYEVRAELLDDSDHRGDVLTLGDLGSWLDEVAPSPAADYKLSHNEAALVLEYRQSVAAFKTWDARHKRFASADSFANYVLGSSVSDVRARLETTSQYGNAPTYFKAEVRPGTPLPRVQVQLLFDNDDPGGIWYGNLGQVDAQLPAWITEQLALAGRTEA